MVKTMLIRRSAPQPVSRKTPNGGSRMAKMSLQTSLERILSVSENPKPPNKFYIIK